MDYTQANNEKNTYQDIKEQEIEDMKLHLEKQIAVAVWIQTVGIIAEAVLLLKLFMLGEDSDGEEKVVTGVWIQAIGQLFEAIGVSKQVSTTAKEMILEAQRIAITGDWLQSMGAAIEALGAEQVLVEEQQIEQTEFVP